MLRLAEHTVGAILSAGLHAAVVSSDSAVTAWGAAHAVQVVPEPPVGGLDAAALAGASAVPGPWMVVHADLPTLTVEDMVAAAQLADRTTVAEGAFTAPVLREAAHDAGVEMPITEAVCALLEGKISVEAAVEALMARPLKNER